ncbi:hypothetical protein C1645_826451 [Glomus cerebriforme]|uniref:Uncharacterized protein n=1 Tax=Glomus cerebriforme TaxID=658196 RepID=A0A397SWJ9_9GLOM|nr:hypothetical protein C1645_826451 [Glomus cerebriforme]
MSEPAVNSGFRILHSRDSPKTFSEIFDKWVASLKFIQKQNKVPKSIVKFMEELMKHNQSNEFKNLQVTCEQDFHAHVLLTLSSGSVTKSKMAKGYMKQVSDILAGAIGEQDEELDEELDEKFDEDGTNVSTLLQNKQNSNQKYSYDTPRYAIVIELTKSIYEFNDEQTSLSPSPVASSSTHNNLKRKIEDDQSDFEELSLLFDESNEDILVENINENVLEQETILPHTSDSSKIRPKNIDAYIIKAFHNYQNTIPKTRRVIIKNIQQYFDSNCEIKYSDSELIYRKSDMVSFQEMLTEKELKMSIVFPLFRGIFTTGKIKNTWREVQALSTNYACNEKGNPFKRARMGRKVDMKSTLIQTSNKFEVIYGKVTEGLGPFGTPTACHRKRYLNKLKLMIIMRDNINHLLKECKYVSSEKCLELNFYAMDWLGAGIYRFGLVDQCRLPSAEDECGILENTYCILKSLEKLLEYNPKYFSKNGFIQMIERLYKDEEFKAGRCSFHIYCTIYDSLNVKKGGSVSSLSSDEVDEIYLTYLVMYSKGLAHYSYDYSHEGRKKIVNHLIDSVKVIQQAWIAFKLRPET